MIITTTSTFLTTSFALPNPGNLQLEPQSLPPHRFHFAPQTPFTSKLPWILKKEILSTILISAAYFIWLLVSLSIENYIVECHWILLPANQFHMFQGHRSIIIIFISRNIFHIFQVKFNHVLYCSVFNICSVKIHLTTLCCSDAEGVSSTSEAVQTFPGALRGEFAFSSGHISQWKSCFLFSPLVWLKNSGKKILRSPLLKNSWCKTFASVNFLDCQKAWEEKFHWKARMWKSVHNVFLSKSAAKFSLQFHILLNNCICTFKDKVQAEWGVFIEMWKLRSFLGLPPIHSDKHKDGDFSRVAPIHSLRSSIVHICLLFPQKQKAIIELKETSPKTTFFFLPSDIFHSISIWWLYVFCYYANKVVKCWDIQNNNVHHWQNMIKFGMKKMWLRNF